MKAFLPFFLLILSAHAHWNSGHATSVCSGGSQVLRFQHDLNGSEIQRINDVIYNTQQDLTILLFADVQLHLQMPRYPRLGQKVLFVCDSSIWHLVSDNKGFQGAARYVSDQGQVVEVRDSLGLQLLQRTTVELIYNSQQWIIINQPVIGETF